MAEAAAEQCDLDWVLLVPASHPPHRSAGPFASYADRLKMVELACQDHRRLAPSNLDDAPGKSYSIHTVERLRATLPDDSSIYFLIGADAFADIKSWHRWSDLARLVTFAVVSRPGAIYEQPPEVRIHSVNGIHLPISSSDIRARLASGDLRVDLPPRVLHYIQQHRLYGFAG